MIDSTGGQPAEGTAAPEPRGIFGLSKADERKVLAGMDCRDAMAGCDAAAKLCCSHPVHALAAVRTAMKNLQAAERWLEGASS